MVIEQFVQSKWWLDIGLVYFLSFFHLCFAFMQNFEFVSVLNKYIKEPGQYTAILTSCLVNNTHISILVILSKHLQWNLDITKSQGTTTRDKVSTHFRKMALFCIVDILIPFPCLPQPLPPKINVKFWTLKSFFT